MKPHIQWISNTVMGAVLLWFIMGATQSWPTYVNGAEKKRAVESFRQAKSLPGSAIEHRVEFSPATHYRHIDGKDLSGPTKQMVQDLGFSLSVNLSLAAHEVSRFYREHRRLVPSDVMSFILDSSGATYWGVQQTALVTTNTSAHAVEALIQDQITAENRGWDIGISDEIDPENDGLRIIIVLLAERTIDLQPIPRRLATQRTYSVKGTLAPGYTDPHVLVMGPDGRIEERDVVQRGSDFQTSVGGEAGTWVMEIMASGPTGPIPLTQMTLHVDGPIPRTVRSEWPKDESTVLDKEGYLLALINRSRLQYGLKTLERVKALDSVAIGHSRDMATHQFVGHVSPQTGTLTQRMDKVDHPRKVYGENVALNTTIFDAHLGLMRSLGHRRNLLSPRFTELGLGIVEGPSGWYVTEVFNYPGRTHSTKMSKRPNSADDRPYALRAIAARE